MLNAISDETEIVRVKMYNSGRRSWPSGVIGVLILLSALVGIQGMIGPVEASGNRGLSVVLRQSEGANSPSAGMVELYQKSYALVIGIDAYRDQAWSRLSNAVKDAKGVAGALEEKGFEVTLATDLNSEQLEQKLKHFFIRKGRDPEARLFIWYAGHGFTLNGEGFLIPANGKSPSDEVAFLDTAISLRDFGKFSRYAKSKHVLAVFDSCFAGTVFNVARSAPPAAITRVTTEPVRQFLSSGDAGQEVSDDGLFANLFIEALSGRNRADANGDGYLTGSEIGAHLTYQVSNLTSNQQTPRYGKLRAQKFSNGDFVFQLASRQDVKSVSSLELNKPSGQGTSVAAPADKEVIFWAAVEKSNDPLLFKAYLEQYPNGNFAPLARAKIEVLANSKVQDKKVQERAEVRVEERDERLWVGAKLLSVRRGPGTKFDKIGRLSQGTEVEITGKVADSNWYRIKTENGSIGFVFGKYLDQEAPRSNSDVARTEPQPASVTASSSQSRRSAPSGQIEIVNASRLKISPSAYQLIKDTVRRSISGREWTAVERVTVRLTNLGARKERNPDYAGAKLAQGVFGALVGRNIQLGNVAATNTFLHAEVTVIAVLKDGTSWTDAGTHTLKGDGRSNRRLSIQMQETVM